MSGLALIAIGVVFVVTGLRISASSADTNVRISNSGFVLFGSLKQSIDNIRAAIGGTKEKTPRDWIGWSLSGIGVVLGVIGLLK